MYDSKKAKVKVPIDERPYLYLLLRRVVCSEYRNFGFIRRNPILIYSNESKNLDSTARRNPTKRRYNFGLSFEGHKRKLSH